MQTPSLATIRAKNKAAGGHFFDRNTLKWFGDTLSNFRVVKGLGGFIYVERKNITAKGAKPARWPWNPETGRFGSGSLVGDKSDFARK
jgi:hypothetical protein